VQRRQISNDDPAGVECNSRGQRPRFRQVADGVEYGLQFDRIRRKVLFGSDEPFFSQRLALERYLELPDRDLFLIENFLSLLQKAGLT